MHVLAVIVAGGAGGVLADPYSYAASGLPHGARGSDASHGALTALKLGLVDDVVEETFEAMKQRYGRRIFLKRRRRAATDPPPPPLQARSRRSRRRLSAFRLGLHLPHPRVQHVHDSPRTVAPRAPPSRTASGFSSRLINSRLK